MRRLKDVNERALKLTFKDPDTGYQYNAYYRDMKALLKHIAAYRRINKLKDIPELANLVELYVAEVPENLRYTEVIAEPVPLSLKEYISGGSAFLQTAIREWRMKKVWVSGEVAEGRARICARCPFNTGGIKDFNVFEKAVRFLQKIQVGDKQTRYDNQLGQCVLCMCDLKKKIWYPQDIVERTLDKVVKMRLPKGDTRGIDGELVYCWQLGEKKNG